MKRLLFGLFLTMSLACGGLTGDLGGDEAATSAPQAGDADLGARLGAIAKELQARPGESEAVLSEHGLSRAEFEALLYDAAKDADQAKAYADALGT